MTAINTVDSNDVHWQFASFFEDERIQPYAYWLSRSLAEGNICIDIHLPAQLVEVSPFQTVFPASNLSELSLLVTRNDQEYKRPFVLHRGKLYFQRYFNYESMILEKIKSMIALERDTLTERMHQLDQQREVIGSLVGNYDLQGLLPHEKIDWQLVSAIQSLTNNFSIITGGPGTGKTTTLAKLLRILFAIEPDARVALAAPTGKASMRMYESLKKSAVAFPEEIKSKMDDLQPRTIHSLLGYLRDTVYFKHDGQNPLPFDWVIVDEASMIDVPMFAKLLDALGEKTRIVLLGDKDQLASVEAGSLLGDLCQTLSTQNGFSLDKASWINSFIADEARVISEQFMQQDKTLFAGHIIELMFSHRFQKQGIIGVVSKAIIHNDEAVINRLINESPDLSLVFDEHYNDSILEHFAKGFEDYISETDIASALKKLNALRVLVAVREGERGLYGVNKKIENYLRKMNLLHIDNEFYINRPLMVTRNMYEFGLFNGDIGIVRTDEKGNVRVYFDGGEGAPRPVLPAYLNEAETVFAMTIHKSQGSEFDKVLVVLPEGIEHPLLTRELLYTGITRAKKEIVIQGTRETILHTADNCIKRISGIANRIMQEA